MNLANVQASDRVSFVRKTIKLTNDPEEKGAAIGKKRGRMVEKETIARNLKGFGVSLEQIAKARGYRSKRSKH
jgi:hypothetical protein